MQKISIWAKGHIAAARFYIVLIKLMLVVLAYYTGITLYHMQLQLPVAPLYIIAVSLMLAAVLFYPVRGKIILPKKLYYIRQKTCDFILPLSAVLVFTTWVNNADTIAIQSPAYATTVIKHPTAQEILNSGKTKQTLTRQENAF